jgi:hypothetical protein
MFMQAAYLANVDTAIKEANAALAEDGDSILLAHDKEKEQKRSVRMAKKLYDEAKEVRGTISRSPVPRACFKLWLLQLGHVPSLPPPPPAPTWP